MNAIWHGLSRRMATYILNHLSIALVAVFAYAAAAQLNLASLDQKMTISPNSSQLTLASSHVFFLSRAWEIYSLECEDNYGRHYSFLKQCTDFWGEEFKSRVDSLAASGPVTSLRTERIRNLRNLLSDQPGGPTYFPITSFIPCLRENIGIPMEIKTFALLVRYSHPALREI